MADLACKAIWETLATLPDGYVEVMYRARPYGLTMKRFNDGQSVKLYAEELGGRDRISANFYSCASGVYVMPCEMTQDKVTRFLLAFERT